MGQSNHIDLSALCDIVCGGFEMDAESRGHIELCEECRANLGWLHWLADFASRDKGNEPPSWALTNANNVFKLKKPRTVTVAREIVAQLVYDSFNEPLPAGVRQHDLPARQTLYTTLDLQLDLKIEVGEENGLIIGQIVATGDLKVAGLRVEIAEHGMVVDNAVTNGLGEFVFQDLPKGNYELQIVLSDTTVKLPSLPL
jgi:hypothetical protein